MFKIPSKLSISISLVLAVILFVAIIVGAVFMPVIVDYLIDIDNNIERILFLPDEVEHVQDITSRSQIFILIEAYLLLAIAMIADLMLFMLLIRVRKGKVFTPISVSLIRGVSWCCFLAALVILILGMYFQLAYILVFAAVFLGFCLHVVKNVIEEATRIKNENDLTV